MKPVTHARLNVALDAAARALGAVSAAQRTILRTLVNETIRIARRDAEEPEHWTPERSSVPQVIDDDKTPVRWPTRRS